MGTTAVPDLDPVAERLLAESRQRWDVPLRGRERAARWLAAGAFVLVAVPLALTAPTSRHLDALLLVVLLVSFALASRVAFEVGSGFAAPTELVLVPMLFLLPPAFVPLTVAGGLALAQLPAYLRREVPLGRIVVPIGNAWFALGPALVFVAFGSPGPRLHGWAVLAVALVAQFAFDLSGSFAREHLALGVRPRHLLQPLAWSIAVDACLAPIGLAVASAAATTTRGAVLLLIPLYALLTLFSHERVQRLGHELELSHAYRGTAFLLGDVIEADDEYTGTHSRQVVDIVLELCERLGLDERTRRKAEFTALLHDIGKIRIPQAIINKPGPLTLDEWAIIKRHTIEGESLLTPIGGLLAEVGGTVRSCHEAYDGRGYPDGLAGDDIPLIARIVSACDAFNAMVTDRPYRKALTTEAALRELQDNRGTQFDPGIVDTLVAIILENGEANPLTEAAAAPNRAPSP